MGRTPTFSAPAARVGLWVTGMALLVGSSLRAVEADANQDYPITPEVGPYTICAASFQGEFSHEHAKMLVRELRSDYGLYAYTFNRGAEQRREQEAMLQRQREMQREYIRRQGANPDQIQLPVRRVRIEDQYAVLIGGYKDMDSANRDLKRIKGLKEPTKVPLASVVKWIRDPAGSGDQGAQPKQVEEKVNPFLSSFVVRNPLMPVPKEASDQPDKFLIQLNADEPYNLYKCPKPWTLVVKNFQGVITVQPQAAGSSFWEKLGFSDDKAANYMDGLARQAREVAKVLRAMGFEAYVLHTRSGSLVTVGGYDRMDDPKLLQNQKLLRNLNFPQAGIQLAPQPTPMEVPKS